MASNPHKSGSPEWQLWENMESTRALERAHRQDIERLQLKAAECRSRAEQFERALAILGAASE